MVSIAPAQEAGIGKPPHATYEMTLKAIEDAGKGSEQYGAKDRLLFKYLITRYIPESAVDQDEEDAAEEWVGREWWAYMDAELTNGNNLGRHTKAILGIDKIEAGFAPDTDDMIGKKIKATLGWAVTGQGVKYYTLMSGGPIKKKAKVAPPPVDDDDDDEGVDF